MNKQKKEDVSVGSGAVSMPSFPLGMKRKDVDGGVDLKTVIDVLVIILEELENDKREKGTIVSREGADVSRGTGTIEEEIQDTINY